MVCNMLDDFEIVVHSSKDESSMLAEVTSLNKNIMKCLECGAPKVLFVTIVGFSTKLSITTCDALLDTMRRFAQKFPSYPRHLRLFRIDQRAEWCNYFLSVIQKEGFLAPILDLELHSELHPCVLRCVESLLRENSLKQLRIDAVHLSFGEESDDQKNILLALEENRSLESLWFEAFYPVGGYVSLIRSLLSKPVLRIVSLREPDTREEAIALQHLLAHPSCPIEELTINHSPHTSKGCHRIIWTLDAMTRPNQSIKTIRFLNRGKVQSNHIASILSSFLSLEEIYIPHCSLLHLPVPKSRFGRLPTNLRLIDLTGSEIVDRWDDLDTRALILAYGSLLQYRILFPRLQILGFSFNHKILTGFPKFLAEQRRIPASAWPLLFSLLSMTGVKRDGESDQVQSPDLYYDVLQIFLFHQASGLVPDPRDITSNIDEPCLEKDTEKSSLITPLLNGRSRIISSHALLRAFC